MLEFSLRDLLWIGSLLVSITISYSKLHSEIRHLEDTKADQRDLTRLGEDLRATLSEIRTSLVRLEESIRQFPRADKNDQL